MTDLHKRIEEILRERDRQAREVFDIQGCAADLTTLFKQELEALAGAARQREEAAYNKGYEEGRNNRGKI